MVRYAISAFPRLLSHSPFSRSFCFPCSTTLAIKFPNPAAITVSSTFPLRLAEAMSSTSSHAEKITAPYGSWKSPISSDAVSSSSKRLSGTAIDGFGRLYWIESRPAEAGRNVVVRAPEEPNMKSVDITSKELSVATSAMDYGGGACCISGNSIFFSNNKDQRLYKQYTEPEAIAIPLTPDYDGPHVSYADGVFDERFNRYITVMEDRRLSRSKSTTTIAAVDLGANVIKEPRVLISGSDFYAYPRLDPKGNRIAWIQWSHPNMPWDRSELWVGYIAEDGEIRDRICVAGNDPTLLESPTEPKWTSDGELVFISDRNNGFWNLYKWIESENRMEAIYPDDAEFCRPLWVFGMNSYEFIRRNGESYKILCTFRKNGRSYLGVVDPAKKDMSLLDIPFTDIDNITSGKGCLYVEGASTVLPTSVAKVTLKEREFAVQRFEILWSSSSDCSDYNSFLSRPELISFPTEINGEYAYAYYYPPYNPLYQSTDNEKPPLLLKCHGGPTSETRGALNLSIQYWTSRGWAFVDVNYGGSSGYGRSYRERLTGKWGIVDVNDCCSCATFLVESGKVDGDRLCITGSSAGGFTALCALAFRNTFKAGASLYGVADLKLLRGDIPKFESHYIDNLVGSEKGFLERSPINFVDRFSCPIILFQGLKDKVVPANQARRIYEALKKRGVPVALVEYEDELHGFRKAESIKTTIEQQLVFFARMVGHFDVADHITPFPIQNCD